MARRRSPFRWFRKNQAAAMVVLTLLAMFSFIIVPSLMELMPQSGSAAPTDIARCREFGKINDRSLYSLQLNRQRLAGFFMNLLHGLARQHGENNEALRNLGAFANQLSGMVSDEDLINDWLLVQYAQKKLGLTISDQEVNDYLRLLTSGLNSDALTNRAMQGAEMNAAMLRARLREHMIRERVLTMLLRYQDPISPLTRWQWFQRTNRKITAEVAAVPVELFVAKVADPSPQELQKFFDENRSREALPGSPESGFMQPDRIAFQYVKLVPSDAMLDSISAEDIEKYYEENKIRMFRRPVTPIGPQPGGALQPGAIPFPTLFNTTPLRRSEDAAEEVSEAEPATEPASEAPETPMPEDKPTDTPMQEEEEKAEETDEMDEMGEMGETSFLRAVPTTRPVSFLDETPLDDAPMPTMEDGKTEEEPSDEPMPEEISATLEAPTTTPELPVLEAPTTIPLAPGSEIDLSILFIPLSEVEDDIRLALARPLLSEATLEIDSKMREYSRAYNYNIDRKRDAPPALDLKALADEYGFEFFETSPVAFSEVQRLDFARGLNERQFLVRQFASPPVLFEPLTVAGSEAQYLFWATEFQKQQEPKSLDDVRDAVVNRWKEVQARSLALTRAEELAKQAAGVSLAEAFANQGDVKTVETEPFTWDSEYAIIYMMQGNPPPLGEIREKGVAVGDAEFDNQLIVAPGEGFMEVAYGLAVDGIGVSMNQSETVAYIIRVTESSPPIEELRTQFQSDPPNPYLYAGRRLEMTREAYDAHIERIQNEVGFKWINKPTRRW